MVLASPWQTCHPDWGASRLWWGRLDCGDASGASAAFTSRGKNTPEDFTVKSSNFGMFLCLNSSKLAVIEVDHTFCLLLISCRTFKRPLFIRIQILYYIFKIQTCNRQLWMNSSQLDYLVNLQRRKETKVMGLESANFRETLLKIVVSLLPIFGFQESGEARLFHQSTKDLFTIWKPRWRTFLRSFIPPSSPNLAFRETMIHVSLVCLNKCGSLTAAVRWKLCKYRNKYIVSFTVM